MIKNIIKFQQAYKFTGVKTIDYISDIHLECWKTITKKSIETNFKTQYTDIRNVLCIAGDICNPYDKKYAEFINIVSNFYKKIFITSGNHEYYDDYRNMEMIDNKAKTICKKYGVEYLNKNVVNYMGHRFAGCTLWTYINKTSNEQSTNDITKMMYDYQKIKGFTIEKQNELHKDHIKWLSEMINNSENTPIIVMTHHLPTIDFVYEKYLNTILSTAFYSNSDDLIKPPVMLWICGHTHYKKYFIKNGVICAVNPYGYHNITPKHKNKNKLETIIL